MLEQNRYRIVLNTCARGLLTLVALMALFVAHAQVEDASYQKMLEKLLDHDVTEVSVQDLIVEQHEYILLDARELNEYSVSHIKNSVFVGYDDFSLKSVEHIAKEQKIVVYCSVGYRSEKVAQKLTKAGYTNVVNLFGGIFEWVNAEQEVVSNGKATTNVHGYDKDWSKWLTEGNVILK